MSEKSSGSFFSNLISSLFGGNNADADKKRQLKNISKKYSKSKYNKFYKYSGNEILPALGKLFYDLYKAIYPVQTMFHAAQNPNVFKSLLIHFSIPEDIQNLEDSLSEQKITEMSTKIPLDQLKQQVNERISTYSDYFTLERITEIDNLNKQLSALQAFSTYDFYFVLKKFDKTLHEGDFSTTPHFEKVNAEYLLEDIKDFISVAYAIPFDADWTTLFKILKAYKTVEPISIGLWKRIVSKLQSIRLSESLDLIIKMISAEPSTTVDVASYSSNIVEPYIEKIKNETENCLYNLLSKERDNKTNNLVQQLFGDTELVPLRNYTTVLNSTLERKGITPYTYTQALSYLKGFIIEVVKKDIHEYYDLVIVRGQWESQSLCAPFNDGYNHLLSQFDLISSFDASLAEDVGTGLKIKTLLPKTERDNSAKNIINRLVTEANERAYGFISDCTKDVIEIGKIIKSIVEDSAKSKPTMISNWKDLEHYCEVPLRDYSISIYKKIYLFTNLIKTCLPS